MKRVLITGAGTGIGLACVHAFLKGGWDILAHYKRSREDLDKLEKDLPPGQLELIQSDFRKPDDIKKFIQRIQREKISALVNNAGIYDLSSGKENEFSLIQEVLLVNTIAPTLIAQTVFESMREQKGGHIVNVSSIAAHYGSSNESIFYGVSKRGLEAAVRTLGRLGAKHHICVNTVRPGVFKTAFHDRIGRDARDMEARKQMIPKGQFGPVDEVARLIYTLCVGNTFMNNQILTIAGGEEIGRHEAISI